MARFLYFLFTASGVVVSLSISAAWIALRPRSAAARRFLIVVAAVYLAASTYAVPAAVSALLARPFHRFEKSDVPPGRIALVVFGAGNETIGGWESQLSIPSDVAAARVLEAWRVYRIARPAWVISSGGLPSPDDPSEPSSTNMRDMLVRLGVPAQQIVTESASRETHENALAAAALVRELHADAVVLVTSAVHMRRALGAIRAAGLLATPAAAPDPWFQNTWHAWLLPTDHGLYFSGAVAHEVLGIPSYWLRGWWR